MMCIAAHEMKRLNLAHKPMIIGLKANVEFFASHLLHFRIALVGKDVLCLLDAIRQIFPAG